MIRRVHSETKGLLVAASAIRDLHLALFHSSPCSRPNSHGLVAHIPTTLANREINLQQAIQPGTVLHCSWSVFSRQTIQPSSPVLSSVELPLLVGAVAQFYKQTHLPIYLVRGEISTGGISFFLPQFFLKPFFLHRRQTVRILLSLPRAVYIILIQIYTGSFF